jgi:hypothetical protein
VSFAQPFAGDPADAPLVPCTCATVPQPPPFAFASYNHQGFNRVVNRQVERAPYAPALDPAGVPYPMTSRLAARRAARHAGKMATQAFAPPPPGFPGFVGAPQFAPTPAPQGFIGGPSSYVGVAGKNLHQRIGDAPSPVINFMSVVRPAQPQYYYVPYPVPVPAPAPVAYEAE